MKTSDHNFSSNNLGKGSKRRLENPKKVRDNWDQIKGFRKGKFK
jgi:hypothetical protein